MFIVLLHDLSEREFSAQNSSVKYQSGAIDINFYLKRFSDDFIISAKKYLKMPAATEQPAAKREEREELLWQSLKEHVMRERQKIKEGTVFHPQYTIENCFD